MPQNPNWPVIEDAWGPSWNANGGALPTSRYVDITSRSLHQSTTKRGRQYELDQVQAGEYDTSLDNRDGAFDPTNVSGPWAGRIWPYQPIRKRAQWPPTANLLSQTQASGGDGYTAGLIPPEFGFVFPTVAIPGTIAVLGSGVAWQGLNAFSFAVPSGSVVNTAIFRTDTPSVTPGQMYTFSLYAQASASVTLLPYIDWLNADGSTVWGNGSVTVVTGAAWQRLTVTATAPASCFGMRLGLNLGAAASTASTVLLDGLQLEKGATATAWAQPGTWYPLFGGFTERLPSTWTNGGTYGEVQPTAVDAFALLSQQVLNDPLTEEINGLNPRFLFKLDDPQDSAGAADATGTYPAAQIIDSKYGPGTASFGTQIGATNTSGLFAGTGSVLTLTNSDPGQDYDVAPASALSLTTAGIKGPASKSWTRMVAFRWALGTAIPYVVSLWSCVDPNGGNEPDDEQFIALFPTGQVAIGLRSKVNPLDANFSLYIYDTSNVNGVDGNWHLAFYGYDGVNNVAMLSVDGHYITQVPPTGNTYNVTSIITDTLGAWVNSNVGNDAQGVFCGDLAFAAEFSTLLGAADIANLYKAWRSAYAGESSGARYRRILRYAGYTGATNIGTGVTSGMGPASDISGADTVSALQAVVDTENGEHFVAADGSIVFRGRDHRYNTLTPSVTFGEGPGEYPYEDCQLDFDSTHLANLARITQSSTGQIFTASDATSTANYFTRTFQRTVNAADPYECQAAASYLVSRYKDPLTRVSTLTLHPSAHQELWPVLLGLELGARVRVMRRPFGAPAIQLDLWVENIAWDFNDGGDAVVTLQCSPVDATQYATFPAWHSITAQAYPAGTYGIAVAPNGDNTNPLATQIAAGTRITLEPGTANAETLTLAGVGATSPGWPSGTLSCVAPTTRAHPAGAVVCEFLPNSVSDPTTWDSANKFDAPALAY